MQETNINEIDSYLKKLHNSINEADNDEKLLNEAQTVLNTIDKLNKREKYARILRFLGILLLILGLIVLFWEHCYIHVVYLARLIVVTVNI